MIQVKVKTNRNILTVTKNVYRFFANEYLEVKNEVDQKYFKDNVERFQIDSILNDDSSEFIKAPEVENEVLEVLELSEKKSKKSKKNETDTINE